MQRQAAHSALVPHHDALDAPGVRAPHDDAPVHAARDEAVEVVCADEVGDDVAVPRDLEEGCGLVDVPAVYGPVGGHRAEHLVGGAPAELEEEVCVKDLGVEHDVDLFAAHGPLLLAHRDAMIRRAEGVHVPAGQEDDVVDEHLGRVLLDLLHGALGACLALLDHVVGPEHGARAEPLVEDLNAVLFVGYDDEAPRVGEVLHASAGSKRRAPLLPQCDVFRVLDDVLVHALHHDALRGGRLDAKGGELVPVRAAIAVVVDLLEHLLDHGHRVGALGGLCDEWVRFKELLENDLCKGGDVEAARHGHEFLLELGQGQRRERRAEVLDGTKEPRLVLLQRGHRAHDD